MMNPSTVLARLEPALGEKYGYFVKRNRTGNQYTSHTVHSTNSTMLTNNAMLLDKTPPSIASWIMACCDKI